jgi:hypothetical protein
LRCPSQGKRFLIMESAPDARTSAVDDKCVTQ